MQSNRKVYTLAGRLALLVVLVLALAGCYPQYSVLVDVAGLPSAGETVAPPADTRVAGNTDVIRKLIVEAGGITNEGPLSVAGATTLTGDVTAAGDLAVTGAVTAGTLACTTTELDQDIVITGTLNGRGAVTLWSTLGMTVTNAASGSANPVDITSALGIMNGSDDYTALDVNITNADHTGSNTIQGLDISAITADGQATETAIVVGTGWDTGLDLNGTPLVIGADGGVILDESSDGVVALTMGAGTETFSVLTGNLKVGAGSPGTAQDGDDAYVTGGFEVDGTAKLDGTINAGGAVNVTGVLAADGGITVDTANFSVSGASGAIVGAGGASIAGFTKFTAATAITLTNGGTLTITGTYQPVTAAGGVGVGIADTSCNTAGRLSIIANLSNQTVTITDTSTIMLAGNAALAQYDTLMLIGDGTNCLQIGKADN